MSGETNSVVVWYEMLWTTIFLFPIFYLIQDLMKLFWYIGEIRPIFTSIILCGCSTCLILQTRIFCYVAILSMRALRPRFHATSGFFPNRCIIEMRYRRKVVYFDRSKLYWLTLTSFALQVCHPSCALHFSASCQKGRQKRFDVLGGWQ